MKITIKDVAKAAGVSPSTVSRALQGNNRISAEVRALVQRVAQEMNFHPNQMARSLVNRQTQIIGIVFPDDAGMNLGNPFYPAVLQGLGQVASENRYHMLLITGGSQMTAAQASQFAVEGGYVSGLILLAAEVKAPAETHVPMVVIGHPVDAQNRYCVDNANVRAGYEATRYLLDHGHERILLLGYDAKYMFSVDRRQGYEQALSEAGLPVHEPWICHNRLIQHPEQSAELCELFCAPNRPTAVVCMDDAMAVGLTRLLGGMGLSVPEDVSLISFNNTETSRYHNPPLTTYDVEPYQLGMSAMTLMLDVLSGKAGQPVSIEVPFTLVERQSVASIGPAIAKIK